jgi:hypothetical protein
MSEQQHIKAELASHAPGLPFPATAMPHSVPAGYFEQLPLAVLERIRLESDELPSVLLSLKEENAHRPGWPYQAPVGYFEQTPKEISTLTNETNTQGTATIIPLRKRSLFRYAVAAAILATIFGVGRWYQQRSLPDIETDPANWVRHQINKESSEKIENYIDGSLIETTDLSTDHKQEIALLTKDIDEKEILLLLSDTDLLAATTGESADTQKLLN